MTSRDAYAFIDLQPRSASLRDDVVRGLSLRQKALPPKYFYDSRGSALFERICRLPEYYPTRVEMDIMVSISGELSERLGPGCALIEYGSGSGLKTRVLLAALKPVAYLPIDIAVDQLKAAAADVAGTFPAIEVIAVCADYTAPLVIDRLERLHARRQVVYFSGSTIGNLTPDDARVFLQRARALVGRGGAMIVGVDLQKDHAVLHAAYNDAQGVTAAFNLNLLRRLNDELGAHFDLQRWSHRAFYNADLGRIEMHLVSDCDQSVAIGGQRFDFRAGETIHTENSYKYTLDGFKALASSAGFTPAASWTDGAHLFAVHYLLAE